MEYKKSAPRYIRPPMSPHGAFLFLLPLPLLFTIAKNVFTANGGDLVPAVIAAVIYLLPLLLLVNMFGIKA